MTDQSGREPEQRLPARRPPSEAAPAARFSAPESAHPAELSPERAAKIVRQSANARWVGFLVLCVVILFMTIYYFYEVGAPLGSVDPAPGRAGGGAAGRGRGARLQPLPGELRAVPRPERRGDERRVHRPGPQRPDEAVRPPERDLPEERPDGRRPVRLRQRRQPDAGLGGHERRPAQLPVDPGAHRLHPRPLDPGVHRPQSGAERAGDRHGRQGRGPSAAGWTRASSRRPMRPRFPPAISATAGAPRRAHGDPAAGRRRPQDHGRGHRVRRPRARGRRPASRSRSTSSRRTPGVGGARRRHPARRTATVVVDNPMPRTTRARSRTSIQAARRGHVHVHLLGPPDPGR